MQHLRSGTRVALFETLDSTSLEAKRQLDAGQSVPAWVIAQHQTAGYGRRGREWDQQPGDFAGTLIFDPKTKSEKFGQLSFVAALAVWDAIDALATNGEARLKWPNDVLIDGAKIAGLLMEYVDTQTGPAILLGIGINIVSHPSNTPYPATRLLDHGCDQPAGVPDLIEALDRNFWAHLGIWRKEGFLPIREHWLEKAHGVGSPIEVRLAAETLHGVFEGLDPSGGLQLRQGDDLEIINAGDVFFSLRQKPSET